MNRITRHTIIVFLLISGTIFADNKSVFDLLKNPKSDFYKYKTMSPGIQAKLPINHIPSAKQNLSHKLPDEIIQHIFRFTLSDSKYKKTLSNFNTLRRTDRLLNKLSEERLIHETFSNYSDEEKFDFLEMLFDRNIPLAKELLKPDPRIHFTCPMLGALVTSKIISILTFESEILSLYT